MEEAYAVHRIVALLREKHFISHRSQKCPQCIYNKRVYIYTYATKRMTAHIIFYVQYKPENRKQQAIIKERNGKKNRGNSYKNHAFLHLDASHNRDGHDNRRNMLL